MRAREWLLFLSLSVPWSGSFLFAKVALRELGPFTTVFFRVPFSLIFWGQTHISSGLA